MAIRNAIVLGATGANQVNVGIGTASPSRTLSVKTATNSIGISHTDGAIELSTYVGGAISGGYFGTVSNHPFAIMTNNSGAQLYVQNGTGRVGIGTSAPTDLLSVNGAANNTTGAWGVFSDERVKTVTGDFTDGLNVIRQIHPVTFNYNPNAPFKADGRQVGVVAQELEKIAPYMVSQKEYGEIKDLREVNNQAYVFLLINGMKEQQKLIDGQQKNFALILMQMADMKKEIEDLKAKK